jgi:multidrug resistance efflux pump
MPKALRTRWIVGGALIVVIVGAVLTRSFRSVQAAFTTLRARDAVDTVLATGRVVGEKTIPLSFVRPGRIAEEFIKDGDFVKAGQVLMNQERAQAETLLASRRNTLALAKLTLEKLGTVDIVDLEQKIRQAKANAQYAGDFFNKQAELFKENSTSALQLDQARRDKELAEATLAAAQNQLESLRGPQRKLAEVQIVQAENDLRQAEIDLRDCYLRAPFDGQIVEHDAHKGEFVGAGQGIVTFIPAAPRTYVEIQVDEANSGKLRIGQKATVVSPAFPGTAYPAAVERTAPIVDTQRGTFSVRLALSESRPELLPESSVSVQVVVGEVTGALLLEQRFIVVEGRESFAFTAEAGRARRRAVAVRDLGNGLFRIDAGLKAGDPVLLPQGLKDGTRVKLVPLGD